MSCRGKNGEWVREPLCWFETAYTINPARLDKEELWGLTRLVDLRFQVVEDGYTDAPDFRLLRDFSVTVRWWLFDDTASGELLEAFEVTDAGERRIIAEKDDIDGFVRFCEEVEAEGSGEIEIERTNHLRWRHFLVERYANGLMERRPDLELDLDYIGETLRDCAVGYDIEHLAAYDLRYDPMSDAQKRARDLLQNLMFDHGKCDKHFC